ncbi:MAG: S8 family serine peptidase [Terriglobia bacterium]
MTLTRNFNPGRRGLLLAVAIVSLLLLPGNPRSEMNSPGANVKLTTVLAELARSVPQRQGPTPLSSTPQAAGFSTSSMPKSARDALQGREMRINSNGEVQVYILMSAVTDENLSQLKANGVTIEIKDTASNRVQARIPISLLQTVSSLPFVNFIRLPTYAVRMTGSVDTEGDAILRADQARQQLGVDGTGVRVGVISDGLKGIFATNCTSCGSVTGGPISTGDLPSATGTRNSSGVLTSSNGGIIGTSFVVGSGAGGSGTAGDLEGIVPGCSFAGAGAEGTALLEIIHDIAPGAQLSFANADTDVAFRQAVNSLAGSNDIVMDDLGFFGVPADGTSAISTNTANALNSTTNPIRAYFTAVGNSADEHYFGTYVDSGVSGVTVSGITNAGDFHLFQQTADTTDVLGLGPKPYNVIKLPPNGEVVIFLTWDDAFGASSNNYDLYLAQQSTNQVVAHSTDAQSGTQDPVEFIDYVNNTGNTDYFHILVQNVQNLAQPKHLNLFSFQPECAADGPRLLLAGHHERHNYNTATRSVAAEGDAGGSPVGVVSVGAICSASTKAQTVFTGSLAPDESCLDTTNSTIEFFSSQGPTLDGRTKPEISAIDGVSITGAGSFENPFFGSSAATPHVAGIAALLLQSKACLLNGAAGAVDNVTARTDLHNLILNNTVPLGGSTPNNIFGFGRADALAAADATIPVFSGGTPFVVGGNTPSGASVTAPQIGFSVPNACPMATLNWTGGCGTGPASSMNCPFGTSNVTVMASNNGTKFSSPANVQIIVTNFSVGASPGSATVTAGQSATFTATVTAQGGAFNSPITLACSGLPAGASCAFNPAKVTPGTVSAQSTLTISTTAHALVPPVNNAPLIRLPQWAPVAWQVQRDIPAQTLWLALVVFALLGWVGIRLAPLAYQRRLATLGATALAVAFFVIQVACGGGSSTPPPASGGTPAGTYNISVTGTSGTLVQSSTVTLVVQ